MGSRDNATLWRVCVIFIALTTATNSLISFHWKTVYGKLMLPTTVNSISLHIKRTKFLSNFNQIWDLSIDFHKRPPISSLTENRSVGDALIRTDGPAWYHFSRRARLYGVPTSSNFAETRLMGAALMHADRRTDVMCFATVPNKQARVEGI